MRPAWLGVAGASLWLALSLPALADETVMVLELEGQKKQAIRERLIRALEEDGIDVEALEKELRGPSPDEGRLARVGTRRKLGLYLAGTTVVKKSGWTLTLVVRDGETGAVQAELPLKAPWLPKLLETIDAEAPKFVREHLGAAAQSEADTQVTLEEEAPSEDKKPETAPPQEETEDEEDAAPAGRPSPLTLGLAFAVVNRSFDYNQDVNGNLRPYELPLAPAVAVALAWYPVAHLTGGGAAHVGLVLDLERSFLASSDLETGRGSFDTVHFAYAMGLRGRLPLGDQELGLSAKFGRQAFTIEGDRDAAASSPSGRQLVRDLVPDVAYTFVRPALDARFAFGPVALGMSVGYRYVLNAGDVEGAAWFPDADVTAGDASLSASYELTPGFHALLGGEVRRYGLAMNSKPTDLAAGNDVAGGALDQYISGWLGLEWRPPGD